MTHPAPVGVQPETEGFVETHARRLQHGAIHRHLLRELLITIVLLLIGVFLLPVAVFHLGGVLFGPYEAGSGGLGSFLDALFTALGQREGAAWVLVLSPLGVVLMLRLGLWLLRARHRRASAAIEET